MIFRVFWRVLRGKIYDGFESDVWKNWKKGLIWRIFGFTDFWRFWQILKKCQKTVFFLCIFGVFLGILGDFVSGVWTFWDYFGLFWTRWVKLEWVLEIFGDFGEIEKKGVFLFWTYFDVFFWRKNEGIFGRIVTRYPYIWRYFGVKIVSEKDVFFMQKSWYFRVIFETCFWSVFWRFLVQDSRKVF